MSKWEKTKRVGLPERNTTVVQETLADGVRFTIPRLGLAGAKVPLMLGAGWTCVWTLGTIATYQDRAESGLLPVLVFAGVSALGPLLLLNGVWLACRSGSIAVVGDRLEVIERGILRTRSHTWPIADLEAVEVCVIDPSTREGEWQRSKQVMELQICPRDDRKFHCFSHVPTADLDWIATSLSAVIAGHAAAEHPMNVLARSESTADDVAGAKAATRMGSAKTVGPKVSEDIEADGFWSHETANWQRDTNVPMRFFASIFGAVVGAGSAALAAMLMWYFIVRVDPRFHTQHSGSLVVGAIAGAILGGSFAYHGRSQQNYLVTICVRAALLSGGWAFCQLALQQEHRLAAVVFWAWGICLVAIGSLVIVAHVLGEQSTKWLVRPAVMSNRKVLAYFVYFAFAASILLVSAYRSGERVLTFRRDDAAKQVHCDLETRGWFGWVQVEHSRLEGVQDWRRAFLEGDGTVLVAASGELFIEGDVSYYNTLAAKIEESLRDFLKSETSSLRLAEKTSYPFWVHCLAAALVVGIGVKFDPLVPWGTKWLIVNHGN